MKRARSSVGQEAPVTPGGGSSASETDVALAAPPALGQPKTRGRRGLLWCGSALLLLAGLYLVLLAFPAPLFRYRMDYRQFRIYATRPIDAAAVRKVLDRAEALLARSPLHDPARTHRVYFLSTFAEFAFFARGNYSAFAVNNIGLRNIFVSRTNWEADLVLADRPAYNRRSLSAVLAHEMIHTLMERRYGLLTNFRVPTWKREGYADYVAGESSFDLERGKALLRAGESDPSPAFLYLRYRLVTEHLLDTKGVSVDEFVEQDFDVPAVESELQERLARQAGSS